MTTPPQRRRPVLPPAPPHLEGLVSPGGCAEETPEPVRHAAGRARAVAWVRPSELLGLASARAVGRGIDFHAELARRARRPAERAAAAWGRALGRRARRLPPATAFGRTGRSPTGGARPGIGSG